MKLQFHLGQSQVLDGQIWCLSMSIPLGDPSLMVPIVREATRFKATLDTVDVPSRDTAVIEGAVAAANSTIPPLPKTIARSVFTAILNSSVAFEHCVFEKFCSA